MKNPTTVERKSERELVVTRTFNAPARIVFEAWTKPELLKRWWAPKSFGVSLFPARRMFVSGASTVSCSATLPRTAHGVLRQVHRSDAALAPRLDQ